MPEIKKSVGEGGLNDTPDVALVQVLLRVIKNARHKPYFNHFVTGRYDSETKKAIIAFQNAHGLASMPGAATAKAVGAIKTKGPATVAKKLVKGMIEVVGEMAATVLPPDKSGLVDVNSNTWKKMVEEAVKIKPDFANLRALPGTRMLYVEGTNAELDASIQEMRDARRRGRSAPVGSAGDGLESNFRDVVIRLIRDVYKQHKIVLKAWGVFSFSRDFDGQLSRVETGSSEAQPGEGNHNYGRAMDIGYKDLKWIKDDGSIASVRNENDFDDHLGWRIPALYDARNRILEKAPRGTGDLFRIRMHSGDNDPNHFQAVNQISAWYPRDPLVHMGQSLVGLLNRVGLGFSLNDLQTLGLRVTTAMTWERGDVAHQYKCDLGYGGDTFALGSATDIFTGRAHVTAALLARATNAVAPAGTPHIHASGISNRQVAAMKQALKALFDLADAHWQDWQALDKDGNAI